MEARARADADHGIDPHLHRASKHPEPELDLVGRPEHGIAFVAHDIGGLEQQRKRPQRRLQKRALLLQIHGRFFLVLRGEQDRTNERDQRIARPYRTAVTIIETPDSAINVCTKIDTRVPWPAAGNDKRTPNAVAPNAEIGIEP